jgi:hypothetical protein
MPSFQVSLLLINLVRLMPFGVPCWGTILCMDKLIGWVKGGVVNGIWSCQSESGFVKGKEAAVHLACLYWLHIHTPFAACVYAIHDSCHCQHIGLLLEHPGIDITLILGWRGSHTHIVLYTRCTPQHTHNFFRPLTLDVLLSVSQEGYAPRETQT